VVGAGEVAGQPQDDRREHDADEHRDDGEQRRVEVSGGDVGVDSAVPDLGERSRQVDERRDRRTAPPRWRRRCRSRG
jgi:hypothetical protein